MPLPSVTLVTDGSALKNPGPGGWAAILIAGDQCKELAGGEPQTTNNRMELSAVLHGLKALKRRCAVTIIADSQYVINGFEKRWVQGWKRRGWKKADGKPVLNRDLWEELDREVARHDVSWEWQKGHVGHALNERADELAKAAARAQRR